MPKWETSFWTGPTIVKQIAEKMRAAGVTVLWEGTERVGVEAEGATKEGARWNVLVDLRRTHGTDFGLR